MKRRYRVRVQHGEHVKDVFVVAHEDADTEVVQAMARREFLRRFGPPLPMCYESQRIMSWEPA